MVLGVTGGVGSGKSAVLDYMEKEYGALVIKADDIARALSETEGPALYAIRELFAEDGVLTPEGLMDRAKVSKVIFCDDEKRRALETILHSGTEGEIKTRINNFQKHDPNRLILVESAIFFESGCDSFCDEVLYVYADEETRFRRVSAGRGYSREKFNSILTNQMTDAAFRDRCALVVDNSGDFDRTREQLGRILGPWTKG